MNTVPESKANDTQDRILDAAEELFVEYGYAATSLRAIANSAGVNLAATNYHFGSKDGLLKAVIHRRIQPVNQERIRRLNTLEESERSLTIKEILEALFYPLAETLPNERLPAVMGRMFSEPESLTRPIMAEEFAEVATRFQAAVGRVYPELEPDELNWRFHLMIGSMIHLLKFPNPIVTHGPDEPFRQSIDHLINYSIAGLSQGEERDHD